MEKTICILARTNRALMPLEQALTAGNVPYHLIGRSGFFSQPEIRAACDYLNACIFPANYVISGILRTDFHPTKYIPRSKLQARFKELKADDESVSYWKLMCDEPRTMVDQKNLESLSNFVHFIHGLSRYRDLNPAEALKTILGLLKVGDYYSEQETPDSDPLENLSELLKMAGKHGSVRDFLDYVRRASAASKKKSGVGLATIHSFKGMEADVVYVVGVQEGLLPHSKATDLQEERNIWFTAASRAKTNLIVTYSGTPSPFLQNVVKCKEQEETCS